MSCLLLVPVQSSVLCAEIACGGVPQHGKARTIRYCMRRIQQQKRRAHQLLHRKFVIIIVSCQPCGAWRLVPNGGCWWQMHAVGRHWPQSINSSCARWVGSLGLVRKLASCMPQPWRVRMVWFIASCAAVRAPCFMHIITVVNRHWWELRRRLLADCSQRSSCRMLGLSWQMRAIATIGRNP